MFQSKDWRIEIGSLQVDVETRLAIRVTNILATIACKQLQ